VTLTFQQARECVLREAQARLRAGRAVIAAEQLRSLEAAGRVLAEPILADRDYPPFARSARDGFAVRSADLPGEFHVIGEVRAGSFFERQVGPGEAVEIMTGAPVPAGADQVVMVEHTKREDGRVRIERPGNAGDNFNPRGSEVPAGGLVLKPGVRIGYAEIAAMAMVGRTQVLVFPKPRIAILPTGDELVEVDQAPEPFQIRNSNSWAIAVQVARAGGLPEILPVARDNYQSTRALVEQGLQADLLLLSGGVSAGKYDIVERVLADLGARFHFDRVKIQPGQPVVFGEARQTMFFGLPGNPASAMVTFETLARAAVELLAGIGEPMLPLLRTRLAKDFRQKTGLTRFLPAFLAAGGSSVTPLDWQGSGDVAALARANAFLVTDPEREFWPAGDEISVLLK
jgi:molybdopterin molybdotransferase